MSDVTASDFMALVELLNEEGPGGIDLGLKAAAPGNGSGNVADLDLEWNAGGSSPHSADSGEGSSEPPRKAECRICQDEDYVDNLEAPCGCNGTLKYAHRDCIQKWCSQKGSIRCEICHQMYTPGYTAPARAAECFAIEIRQSWEADAGRNGAFDRDFEEDPEDDDEGRDFGPTFAGISLWRAAAVALMLVLFIRHLFMVMSNPSLLQDPETYLNLAGFLLPLYCMAQFARLIYGRWTRRNRRVAAAAAAEQRAQV
ncbi:uncharacterized protein [Aristolochia californica]|uniref:uncharacterized protein n=1 Tax=Aristolochia californica TaxID=171875 RepID=UPI0035DF7090